MLVEHDLGRLFLTELENSIIRFEKEPKTIHKLGILSNAAGYADLLQRHIEKENKVVFPYAKNNLEDSVAEMVDRHVTQFEKHAMEEKVQETYLSLLQELQEKYMDSGAGQ